MREVRPGFHPLPHRANVVDVASERGLAVVELDGHEFAGDVGILVDEDDDAAAVRVDVFYLRTYGEFGMVGLSH